MARLLVVIDPSAGIAPGALADAWNADREASAAGRARVEAADSLPGLVESAADYLPGLEELVVIPLAVSLASSVHHDLLGRLIVGLRNGTGDASPVSTLDVPVGGGDVWVAVDVVGSQPPAPPAPGSSAAEMAGWVQQAEFRENPMFGYYEREVDDFLDGVRETFLGLREPPLTAEDVRNIRFSTTEYTEAGFAEVLQQAFQDAAASGTNFRALAMERLQRPGYLIGDVDAFLDQVELALESWIAPSPPRE